MNETDFYEHIDLPTSFGTPTVTRVGHQRVFVWTNAEGGTGIVMARSASATDPVSGQQIESGLAGLGSAGHKVGAVVASVGISGLAPLPERPDLQQLKDLANIGIYSEVHWSSPDRIARSWEGIQEHWAWLNSNGIDLFTRGVWVDPDAESDLFLMRLTAEFGFAGIKNMVARMRQGKAHSKAIGGANPEQ